MDQELRGLPQTAPNIDKKQGFEASAVQEALGWTLEGHQPPKAQHLSWGSSLLSVGLFVQASGAVTAVAVGLPW